MTWVLRPTDTAPPSKAELAALGRTAPVTVWMGAEDDYATAAEVSDWLGERVETMTVFDGIGHYLTLKHWTEALTWLSGRDGDVDQCVGQADERPDQ